MFLSPYMKLGRVHHLVHFNSFFSPAIIVLFGLERLLSMQVSALLFSSSMFISRPLCVCIHFEICFLFQDTIIYFFQHMLICYLTALLIFVICCFCLLALLYTSISLSFFRFSVSQLFVPYVFLNENLPFQTFTFFFIQFLSPLEFSLGSNLNIPLFFHQKTLPLSPP